MTLQHTQKHRSMIIVTPNTNAISVCGVMLCSQFTCAVLQYIQRASGLASVCVPWHRTSCSPSTYLLMFAHSREQATKRVREIHITQCLLNMRRAHIYASAHFIFEVIVNYIEVIQPCDISANEQSVNSLILRAHSFEVINSTQRVSTHS